MNINKQMHKVCDFYEAREHHGDHLWDEYNKDTKSSRKHMSRISTKMNKARRLGIREALKLPEALQSMWMWRFDRRAPNS